MITIPAPDINILQQSIDHELIETLAQVEKIPIAALIWGPTPTSNTPVALARKDLRDRLVASGHLARFSEELVDPNSRLSIMTQQAAQVRVHHIVFSVPDSVGSVAEIHDFARLPRFAPKIVAFVDERWNHGYSNSSLLQLQAIGTCQVKTYDHNDLPKCVIDPALELIRQLQELTFIHGALD